jgi:hypothetical protein
LAGIYQLISFKPFGRFIPQGFTLGYRITPLQGFIATFIQPVGFTHGYQITPLQGFCKRYGA